MPSSRAAAQIASASSCGNTTPPPRLCVFSTATSVVGGKMICPGGLNAARRSAAVNSPPRPDHGELHAGIRRRRTRIRARRYAPHRPPPRRRPDVSAASGRSGSPSCRSARTSPPPCRAVPRSAPATRAPSGPRHTDRRRPARSPSRRASDRSAASPCPNADRSVPCADSLLSPLFRGSRAAAKLAACHACPVQTQMPR